MFAENLQATRWDIAPGLGGVAFGVPFLEVPDSDFVFNRDGAGVPVGNELALEVVSLPSPSGAGTINGLSGPSTLNVGDETGTMEAQDAMPGENILAPPGSLARPSSNHLGTSIYGMADGGAKQLSDFIDWRVYCKLVSPAGQRYGQTTTGLENY